MKKQQETRKAQFIAWLDRQSDPDAWLTKTYQEIGEELDTEGVNASLVRNILGSVMAARLGVEPSEIYKRKAEYRTAARGHLTPAKLQQLREWRTQDPPVPIEDCAYRLDVTLQAIRDRCKEMGL